MKLEYVGKKPTKRGLSGDRRRVWSGPGDIQEIPAEREKDYLKHPMVWRVVDESPVIEEPPVPEGESAAETIKAAVETKKPRRRSTPKKATEE